MNKKKSSATARWVNRLTQVFYVLTVLAAIGTAMSLFLNVVRIAMGDEPPRISIPVEMSLAAPAELQFRGEPTEGVTLHADSGNIRWFQGGVLGWLLDLLPSLILLPFAVAAMHQLRGFTQTLVDGTPFIARNGRRLKWFGGFIVGNEVISFLIGIGVQAYAGSNFYLETGTIDTIPGFDTLTILLGSVIFLIGESFNLGARLQQESDETI